MRLMEWVKGLRHESGNEQVVSAAVLERVIQLTNPRLRFARRYSTRLTPAIEKAMEYARAMVAAIPPAHDASAGAWQSDPYIRAFFATAEDPARAFSRSPDLRAWFGTKSSAQDVYAVLSMELVERKRLGIALEGQIIKRDVPQTNVCFGDYRARIFGESEPDLRQELERRIVDQLALAGLALASDDRSRRVLLDQEHALLRARLKLLQNRGAGMSALGAKEALEQTQLARLRADIAVNEANLASIASGGETLEYQLERLREVLANPAMHFFVTSKRVCLNRQNVVVQEDSAAPRETLDLQIARVPTPDGSSELRTFVLARFPRAQLLDKRDLFSEAARLLH